MKLEELHKTFLQNSGGLADAIRSFVEKYLSMNLLTFAIHLVCALVIIAAISFWVWKPTSEFINKNKKKLDSERMNFVVNNRETQHFLGLIKKERNAIFNIRRQEEEAARREAEKIVSEIKAEAMLDAERRKKETEDKIRIMEANAKDQIKNSVVQVAVELTEKLVGANINDANNKAIIDAYIKELEERKISSNKLN